MELYWHRAVSFFLWTSYEDCDIWSAEDIPSSIDADNFVKIWSPITGELIRNLVGHTKGISDVSWANDSVHLASASDDRTIRIWDVDTVGTVHLCLVSSSSRR